MLILILFSLLFAADPIEKSINNLVAPVTSCDDCKKLTCFELIEAGCNEFNNADQNLSNEYGHIFLGNSKKSEISEVSKIDKMILIETLPKMPPLMSHFLKEPIDKLRELIKQEADEQSWYRKLSMNTQEFNNAFELYVDDLFNKENPPHRADKFSSLPIEMVFKYHKLKREQNRILFKLKYEQSSQWKRVERLFQVVRWDLSETINELNIPDETKKKMIEKVNSVALAFPDDLNCQTTEKNAGYREYKKIFTVCAGYLNAFQNDSSLYITIAHELAHSIDPVNFQFNPKPFLSFFNFKKNEPNKCKELNELENYTRTTMTPNFYLSEFQDCLRGNKQYKKIDLEKIKESCLLNKNDSIDTLATDGSLEKLFNEDKKDRFLNPEYIAMETDLDEQVGYPSELDLMSHFYSCKYDVKTSIEKAKEMSVKICIERHANAGKNSSIAEQYSMGKNIQEDFADWFSYKTYPKFLKKQKENKQLVKYAQVQYCVEKIDPKLDELRNIIKEYSTEHHPEDNRRLIQLFNPEVANLLGCEIDKKKYLDCQIK